MIARKMRVSLSTVVAVLFAVTVAPSQAGTVQITYTNNQPSGGFAVAPVWIGLSDGSFPSFNDGDNLKGTPYQSSAELGSAAALTSAFTGYGPQITVGGSPRLPGASASSLLNVADPSTSRFLNFAAMVVPSNDFFFGNPADRPIMLFNAQGQLIDMNGNPTNTRTIQIFGRQLWDAGTEVDDINFGAAFVSGVSALDHVDADSTARLVFGGGTDFSSYLDSISGKTSGAGYVFTHIITPDDLIATLQFTSVPEPSSLALAAVGLAAVITRVARRRFTVVDGSTRSL